MLIMCAIKLEYFASIKIKFYISIQNILSIILTLKLFMANTLSIDFPHN
jgi:hypothetical protein